MNQLDLFPDLEPVAVDRSSPARRRTTLREAMMAIGAHPLATLVRGLKLHPAAAPASDRKAPGLRCRDCVRVIVQPGTKARYYKCSLYPSRSEASDLRLWWPACQRFLAGDTGRSAPPSMADRPVALPEAETV